MHRRIWFIHDFMCSYAHMQWSLWSPLIKNVEIIYIKPIYACVGVIKSRLLFLASNLWFWKLCDRLGWCRRCSFHLSRIWFKTIHVGITNNLLWKLANYHVIACESRFFFHFQCWFNLFPSPTMLSNRRLHSAKNFRCNQHWGPGVILFKHPIYSKWARSSTNWRDCEYEFAIGRYAVVQSI